MSFCFTSRRHDRCGNAVPVEGLDQDGDFYSWVSVGLWRHSDVSGAEWRTGATCCASAARLACAAAMGLLAAWPSEGVASTSGSTALAGNDVFAEACVALTLA